MTRTTICSLLLVPMLLLWGTGCDSQEKQEEFVARANLPPNGITRTDASGEVIEWDDDDWLSGPFFIGKVRVDPAYPNPVSNEFMTVPFTVLEFNAVRGRMVLRAFNTTGQLVIVDEIRDSGSPGAYSFRFSPASPPFGGREGLHRLYIFDAVGEIVSYGDIEIKNATD